MNSSAPTAQAFTGIKRVLMMTANAGMVLGATLGLGAIEIS
jgi:hypothetical protein